ncbi:hypothetical protein NKJ09_23235 [Mesorhizobium sp. M0189]|uniref:hypothetical protein n=1 Tax=Mesorhizobium sp. M0189 TaxID=2956909 RepID=UPI0033368D09
MIKCLAREDMMAHAAEAVSYHFDGNRYAALFHIRIAMGLASRLKDAAARKVLMQYQNRMRRKCVN